MSFSILIADDEPLIRKGIKAKIDWQALGIDNLQEACDGIDALEKIESFNPDIIITDIKMPGLDGIQLIRKVLSRRQKCKFVFISGYADFEYAKEAIKLGVKDYILKPVDPFELEEVIKQIIASIKEERKAAYGKCRQNNINRQAEEPNTAVYNHTSIQLDFKSADFYFSGSFSKSRKIAEMAKEYIDLNYKDNELNLDKISNSLFLNPDYLRKVFKKELNITVTDYILRARMQRAKELIDCGNSNEKLSSLCYEVGINDPSYFSKCFKRYFGLSPRNYESMFKK